MVLSGPRFGAESERGIEGWVHETPQTGKEVGMVRIQLFSPFPRKELIACLRDVIKIAAIGRFAVETKYYPLYEIRDGQEYAINHHRRRLPVADYLSAQGRFQHLKKRDLDTIQDEVDRDWDRLVKRAHSKCR